MQGPLTGNKVVIKSRTEATVLITANETAVFRTLIELGAESWGKSNRMELEPRRVRGTPNQHSDRRTILLHMARGGVQSAHEINQPAQ